MKKKLILLSFTFIFLLIIVPSCKEDIPAESKNVSKVAHVEPVIEKLLEKEETNSSNYFEIKKGALHFKDLDAYNKFLVILQKMSAEERISYFNDKKFTSFLSEKFKATDELKKMIHEKDGDRILNKYSYILKIDGNNELYFLNNDEVISSIINEDYIFYIGNVLYYYKEDEEVIVLDGDKLKIGAKESDNVKRFKTRQTLTKKSLRVKNGPCQGLWRDLEVGNRRISLFVNHNMYYDYIGNNLYQVRTFYDIRGWSYKKTFWWWGFDWTQQNHLFYGFYNILYSPTGESQQDVIYKDGYGESAHGLYYSGPYKVFNNIPQGNIEGLFIPSFNLDFGHYYTEEISHPGIPFTCY